ncbi:MAG TPA: hypothetical protein VIR03_00815 [Candidatus Saccharimonadales bacterium]
MAQSLFQQARELETLTNKLLASHDLSELPHSEKLLVNDIKHQLIDGRLDTREYEYAQTRAEQLHAAREGKARYELLRQNIVKASEFNLFGSIDVAQLSVYIEQIISQME